METDPARARSTTPGVGWTEPVKNRRAFEQILDQLEAALLAGQLAAGDRLPNERDLAAAFGVSRPSVREALRVLETLGLVDIPRGPDGIRLRTQPGDAFAHLLRLHLALGHYNPDSVFEFRAILESWAAAHLATTPDKEVLGALHAIVERMADTSLTPDAFHTLDVEFHATLVESCGNELAALALRGCRRVIQQAMLDGLAAGTWESTRASLREEHGMLVELIEAGDASSASLAMRDHIHKWANQALAAARLPANGSAHQPRPFTVTPTAETPSATDWD